MELYKFEEFSKLYEFTGNQMPGGFGSNRSGRPNLLQKGKQVSNIGTAASWVTSGLAKAVGGKNGNVFSRALGKLSNFAGKVFGKLGGFVGLLTNGLNDINTAKDKESVENGVDDLSNKMLDFIKNLRKQKMEEVEDAERAAKKAANNPNKKEPVEEPFESYRYNDDIALYESYLEENYDDIVDLIEELYETTQSKELYELSITILEELTDVRV